MRKVFGRGISHAMPETVAGPDTFSEPTGIPRPADGLSPGEAAAELARRLYWNMNRLDPDPEAPAWECLDDRERRFYGLLIKDLFVSTV